MQIDKINGEIAFNDAEHRYFNTKYPDRKYTSVTTLIGKYHEKFDEDFWSGYKALEALSDEFATNGAKHGLLRTKKWSDDYLDLCDVEKEDWLAKKAEIIRGYAVTRDTACERGTSIHNEEENKWYAAEKHNIASLNFGLPLTGEYVCEKHNFDLNREHAVLPEYLVYFSTEDAILNMAGQIDLLVKNGNDIYILDYKTNIKGIETKAYFNTRTKKKTMMFHPINNVEDSTLEHYTLQLSLYAYMLQRINPEFVIKLLRIIHIDAEGEKTFIDLPYRKEEVIKMLKDYKRKLIVEHFRETGKQFDY